MKVHMKRGKVICVWVCGRSVTEKKGDGTLTKCINVARKENRRDRGLRRGKVI